VQYILDMPPQSTQTIRYTIRYFEGENRRPRR